MYFLVVLTKCILLGLGDGSFGKATQVLSIAKKVNQTVYPQNYTSFPPTLCYTQKK